MIYTTHDTQWKTIDEKHFMYVERNQHLTVLNGNTHMARFEY